VPTGARKIKAGRQRAEETVYDLQGHRLDSPVLKKGLLIVNGRKILRE
jgi:hypothetical protein